ncbi:helix-turn-helix domain-containing protein [Heyndrickxia coagulans]
MPNKKTGNPIAKTIGCSRFVFNHFLKPSMQILFLKSWRMM